VEEGGAVDAADVVRRSNCPVVLDVDITTTKAWTLRRETLSTRPDDFMAAIHSVIGCSGRPVPVMDQDRTDRTDRTERQERTDRTLQPAPIPG
jgi:hypothetical protein